MVCCCAGWLIDCFGLGGFVLRFCLVCCLGVLFDVSVLLWLIGFVVRVFVSVLSWFWGLGCCLGVWFCLLCLFSLAWSCLCLCMLVGLLFYFGCLDFGCALVALWVATLLCLFAL